MRYKIKRILPLLITFSALFFLMGVFNTTKASAETVLSKYAKQLSNITSYDNLPAEVKKMVPEPPVSAPGTWEVWTSQSYRHGQCTWYAYERSKIRGREYDPFEGNGGFWQLPQGGTTGDHTPVPQVAVSSNPAETKGLDSRWGVGAEGHVMYAEYIDKEGYMLLSESNVDGFETKHVFYRVGTPEQTSKSGLYYVKPKNWKDIKDWGKNPDGSLPKDSTGESNSDSKTESSSDADSKSKTSSDKTDDKFTVNGYGSITAKDFQEANVGDKLPTQQDIDAMSSSQKQVLMEWIADNDNSTQGTVVKYTRQGVVLLGYLLVLFTLLLALAYAFDRVGVLEFSAVEFITGGNYTTTYTHEQAQELKHSNTGVKPMNLQALAIVSSICLIVFVLIVTGRLYYYAYAIYTFVYNLSDYMNNIRPK